MLRRLFTVTALAAGMTIATATTLATPALAKGPSQAVITGPGLARPIVVSGNGEPGLPGVLSTLATQTDLFTVMFGVNPSNTALPPPRLRTVPSPASLGPRYTITYTVPGVTPQPGEQWGRVRQEIYPRAAGGPVTFTPPGQQGFSGPLQVSGWLRASSQLRRTLSQVGVPARPHVLAAARARHAASRAAAQPAGSPALPWFLASAAALALAGGAALLLRRRKPAAPRAASP